MYGNARPENFPKVNDYRNPIIAEIMKTLGYVNRFSRGIVRVKDEMFSNGAVAPAFDFSRQTVFEVAVPIAQDFAVSKETIQETIQETTRGKIVSLLKKNPKYTIQDLMKILNRAEPTIKEHLSSLKKEGILKREGSTKAGYWEVIE